MKLLEDFKEYLYQISRFNQAVRVMLYDLDTKAPKNAVNARAEAIGEVAGYAFSLSVSDKMGEFLNELTKENIYNELSEDDKAIVNVVKKSYEKTKKIPEELMKKFFITTSKAQSIWKEAKSKADFNIFAPILEEIVEIVKEMAEKYGYEKNRYDALLDLYEPEMTTDQLLKINSYIKSELVPFIEKIRKEGTRPQDKFLKDTFSKEQQEELSMRVLKYMNYDLDSGLLDESEHPFTLKLGHGDVRITTHYYEHDLLNALYSTIHEAGHGLYELGIAEKFENTNVANDLSMAIHESQSRYWENIIGRSRGFWNFLYPDLKDLFPQFQNITAEDIYKASNIVVHSPIRLDSDEVTYNLHIMIRFEIEEALINDRIKVKDLPKVWAEKVTEYVGVTPENDAEGVLQDVHWSGGSFGYFPSYMLGNLYSAQFYNKMREEIPEFDTKIEKGEFQYTLNWLKENIHQHGAKYTPKELVMRATGEELNPKYFVDYVKEKYSSVYNLK